MYLYYFIESLPWVQIFILSKYEVYVDYVYVTFIKICYKKY